MKFKKIITGLTLSILLASKVTVAAADFGKGLLAAHSGDFKTALSEWTPLAEQGHAKAQYHLGFMYDYGKGVPESDKTALKWYTLAAEQRHAKAQFNLGIKYDDGRGVPESDKTAVKWYTLAAEQGHAKSQYNLGIMYFEGAGVLTDNRRAYMWVNLSTYNSNDKNGPKAKNIISKKMTPADISKAQDMSSRCLESGYTDC